MFQQPRRSSLLTRVKSLSSKKSGHHEDPQVGAQDLSSLSSSSASLVSSSSSTLSEPESPIASMRVIQLDSSTSLVLKDEPQSSILNPPPQSAITATSDEAALAEAKPLFVAAAAANTSEHKNRSASLLQLTRPGLGSRTCSEPRMPNNPTAADSPASASSSRSSTSTYMHQDTVSTTTDLDESQPSSCPTTTTSSSFTSRRSSMGSPRVNFAPLPHTPSRSRSGSATYGINARAAMLQATRERRSSNESSGGSASGSMNGPEPRRLFAASLKSGGGSSGSGSGHPADADCGYLREVPNEEALEFDDEDRYGLEEEEEEEEKEERETVGQGQNATESKLWAALQASRTKSRSRPRRDSSAASYSSEHRRGSTSSNYEPPSLFVR